jgi:hypothetical protein
VSEVLGIIPSRGRPRQAREALASFYETATEPNSRCVLVVDADDPTLAEYPADHTFVVEPTGCMGGALALALPKIIGAATVVGMLGDDVRIRTAGWDATFAKWLEARPGIAWGDDLNQSHRKPSHWWVSRSIVDVFGMAPPFLRHLYMDDYWFVMGQGAKCLRFMPSIVMEHLHPDVGKAQVDETYIRGSAPVSPNAQIDRATFEAWRGSPEQLAAVEQLKGIVRARRKEVNVLADYHHAALWESLELLLSDRFGWNLYRPVGPEWFQSGYWRFINMPMNLDWPDFLAVGKQGSLVDGHIELLGTQYPRPMKGVTLEQARAMGWDYVIASVWQHQGSFAKLAQEFGAEFVHQIGNAFNEIDWRLPAKYLISANLRAESPKAVTYHQEFDLKTFRYRKPGRDKRVANFVLRFNWQAAAYKQFNEAQALAQDFEWHDYGSLYGDLIDQRDVAKTMSEQSFIWHDKPIGDGYGHAIHNAAAVGRPIIGHSHHYAGRLAEPFWRDGETCIDLDRHSVPEAVAMMREIMSSPARHRAMCEAMYETFRSVVDFDEDARRVRALLDQP